MWVCVYKNSADVGQRYRRRWLVGPKDLEEETIPVWGHVKQETRKLFYRAYAD
jgi:hypothetical protein